MKKYQIIYADPPWSYKVYSKKGLGRSAESHYPTMCIEDICALPVGDLADKDCALFLWVTIPCLLEGLSVLRAWGFTYKTIGLVYFGVWDIGRAPMWSFVSSQRKGIPSE